MIKLNDIVEFAEPTANEVGVTYVVVEHNGDRCIIEAVAKDGVPFDMAFIPQNTVMTAWLKVAQ